MKIIAIGWNYLDHNKELEHIGPKEPAVFCKPDSALLKGGKPFYIPDFSDRIEYETELVVRIDKVGRNIAKKFANKYYHEIGLGIDFTARDLQAKFRETGSPWELCKAFDFSAPISEFFPVSDFGGNVQDLHFSLDINGETVQKGYTGDMIFDIDFIIEYVSKFFTLKTGDLIFTGTPVGVGPVHQDDHLQGYIEDKPILDFYIK